MWPFRKLDLETFTDDDFEIIQNNPPSNVVRKQLTLAAYRLGCDRVEKKQTVISWERALNNPQQVLARRETKPEVREYLEKRGWIY